MRQRFFAWMALAIAELQKGYPPPGADRGMKLAKGLDRQLIEDGTRLCVDEDGTVAQGVGWSRRPTLSG